MHSPRSMTRSSARLCGVAQSEERVAVNHRRRGFEALLRSPGTVAEDSGTWLQPRRRW
jgi:hypothetical protein